MPLVTNNRLPDAPGLKGQDLIDGFIARNDAESLWVKNRCWLPSWQQSSRSCQARTGA